MQYYFKPVREFPAGRGFADFVYLPKPEYKADYPAMVVELKWNKNVRTAISQIYEKKYPESIADYTGEILLVAINYDKKTKEHERTRKNTNVLLRAGRSRKYKIIPAICMPPFCSIFCRNPACVARCSALIWTKNSVTGKLPASEFFCPDVSPADD